MKNNYIHSINIKASTLGANVVEYALVLAVIVGMVITASQLMRPGVDSMFTKSGDKVISLLNGGTGNQEIPENDGGSNQGDSSSDGGSGFFGSLLNGAVSTVSFTGNVVYGAGEGLWDLGAGVVTLGYDIVRLPFSSDVRGQYADAGRAIWDDPSLIVDAFIEPITDDWNNGNRGQAIGRGLFEVGSIFVAPTKIGKVGKLDEIADIARVTDEVGDVARITDSAATVGRTAARSIDELLPNGRVPSVRNGEFNRWFDELSPEELDMLWENKPLRDQIEARIRQPGDLHEWCMVCRAPEFKNWGVSMDEIKRFRTRTSELTWKDPDTGLPGGHGGTGSTKFHNELRNIIDNSQSLNEFNRDLAILRDRWQIDPNLLPDFPVAG